MTVEEYETTIYQRLFYASVIGPVRAAAWALLGAALAAFGALDPAGSAFATVGDHTLR